jgi:hypothetical protein
VTTRKHIDPNTLFFGNFVDADLRLADLGEFVERIDKYLDKRSKTLAGKPKKGINLELDVEHELFVASFPSILYVSVTIATWVFMEQELKGYCQALQRAMDIDLAFSDLSGSVLERFKKFMGKVAKVELGVRKTLWEDMKAVSEIRNALVHADGLVSNDKIVLIDSFCKRYKVAILNDGRIELDSRAVTMIVVACRLFIELVYGAALLKFPGEYGPKQK